MRQHARRGHEAPDPAQQPPPVVPTRRRRHPLLFAIGALIVLAVVGSAAWAAWSLYSDASWRSDARAASDAVVLTLRSHSVLTGLPPQAVDAVASDPGPGQVAIADLPYGSRIPADVDRFRLSAQGALSVLTASQALCAGVTLDMQGVGSKPSGSFSCGDPLPPTTPVGLSATPRDESVVLNWSLPNTPVEDYAVSLSANGGETWSVVSDGASADTQAVVTALTNGREYLFTVTAVNLIGESSPARARATPFSKPGPPANVQARGGASAVVTWQPPAQDGGRPITGYLVTGTPSGSCRVPADETRCELTDLPGSRGYTFIVRAINEAGLGEPNEPEAGPVSVYSPPGPPVAILTSPGDHVVLLTWTPPLRDGNTPITDYRVQYREVGSDEWQTLARAPSTDTAAAVPGLVNGTTYQFRVIAVNAAGDSPSPVQMPTETPATVPDAVTNITREVGDTVVTLSWQAPQDDGSAVVTDYAIQYRTGTGEWTDLEDEPSVGLSREVSGLVNGTPYSFRIAAVNRIGTGAWSEPVSGRPIGPPGPVVKPESVGSRTAIELSWQPPENDGGRPLTGYRVDYRLSADTDWILSARVPPDTTTWTVEGLTPAESYDFRIQAINSIGPGPANEQKSEEPTLAGVIADETPPAPEGLTAAPADRQVTLTWQASPAGRKSPITAYTVTGKPSGECVTTGLSCVITGLTNGVTYTFRVHAENANIVGKPSKPVRAVPMVFNAATGGTVTTYERDGRTYRVHTFTQGGLFTVTSADQPFSVLVVGGGGGSAQAPGSPLYAGGGGGVIEARTIRLPVGGLNVAVGAGGPPGLPGGVSTLDAVGTAPAGPPGAATLDAFSAPVVSDITGKKRVYGKPGGATSGQGKDGRGQGGGGPALSRGGNGIVIISYEVAPTAAP
ncbi:MAG: hypothetical protein GC156_09455 [Actinomycetales bacterium]|nr:hypothetical protein [Actinomycetales bacterium]